MGGGTPLGGLKRNHYAVILADPAWPFRIYAGDDVVPQRAAQKHYPPMPMADMLALPVAEIAADDCALFMWGIGAMIPEALELGAAWGFKFKTDVFYWEKMGGNHAQDDLFTGPPEPIMSLGYYSRKQVEPCYLFTRGRPKRLDRGIRQLIRAPKREHSRKPPEQYDRIERMFAGPYAELFARTQRPGWDAWGNETDKFAEADAA